MIIRKLYINLIFIIVIFFVNLGFAEQPSDESSRKVIKLPDSFRDLSASSVTFSNSVFYNQKMEKKSLENFDNRFIIIHFWATWCMDCQNELSSLNKLQKEFRKKPLLVLAISEDFKDVSAIDEYFAKHKIDFLDIYVDKKNAIYKYLGINHLPASYLIDFNGDVIASSVPGFPVDWDDENLKKYVEDKVNNHHLLPPEFKGNREEYTESSNQQKKESSSPSQQKIQIF